MSEGSDPPLRTPARSPEPEAAPCTGPLSLALAKPNPPGS